MLRIYIFSLELYFNNGANNTRGHTGARPHPLKSKKNALNDPPSTGSAAGQSPAWLAPHTATPRCRSYQFTS